MRQEMAFQIRIPHCAWPRALPPPFFEQTVLAHTIL